VMKMQAPPDGSAAVLALQPWACKWPIGDPHRPGFTFCGRPALEGEVYCDQHCRLAYPVEGRRKGS
jgi:GcrA cell cycle regulator